MRLLVNTPSEIETCSALTRKDKTGNNDYCCLVKSEKSSNFPIKINMKNQKIETETRLSKLCTVKRSIYVVAKVVDALANSSLAVV